MAETAERQIPILFSFCGPTASGKSTICRRLIEQDFTLRLSVSTTTRSPRPGETDGEDYFFVGEDEFQKKVDDDLFIEHATYSGHLYGTEKRNIKLAASAGVDLLLDIDVQGAIQLKNLYSKSLVAVFVFPDSFTELRRRLINRGSETEEEIDMRLKTAKREVQMLSSADFSDYFLLNDVLDSAVRNAASIISAERLRLSRFAEKFLQETLKPS